MQTMLNVKYDGMKKIFNQLELVAENYDMYNLYYSILTSPKHT